jgi:hypothetical protein
MNTGLMWFDNDPYSTLAAKIGRASDYYRQKFGRLPELCLVSPSMLSGEQDVACPGQKHMTVRAYRALLPGHFWIGIEEQNR